ncbi:MAG: SPOR domain-containing protein [Candidatus Omnitrophica bacterium]|nr:SPOR domain-containing protein [Candidatus Omnitrophota bacterium]
MERSYQEDLFPEDKVQGNDNKSMKKNSGYSRQRYLPYLRIPIEFVPIVAMIWIVIIVIAYAVGIEKGKRNVKGADIIKEEIVDNILNGSGSLGNEPLLSKIIPEQVSPVTERSSQNDKNEVSVINAQDKQEEQKNVAKTQGKSYTIRLVTYAKKENAVDEASKLKSQGYDSDFIQSGKLYQVYVKGYKTIDDATEAQEKFNATYNGCFIREDKQ